MKKTFTIIFICQMAMIGLIYGSENSLNSEELFLESLKSNLPDEDQILKVIDLKHFADVGGPSNDWYDQIIRIKFDLGFRPALIELAKKNRRFEIFIKYTDGDKVAYNDSYYFASKGVQTLHYVIDTTNIHYDSVVDVFKKFNFFSLSPINIGKSAFWHEVEFYSNWQQQTYLKSTIWGKPDQKFLQEGIRKINFIVNALLKKNNASNSLIFEPWNSEVSKWKK